MQDSKGGQVYLVSKTVVSESGREALVREATSRPPFGPGFSEEELEGAEVLEVHGSSFSDPGPDYCEFRLLDAKGEVLKTRQVGGY
jgi:hypothetical protein